MIAIQEKYLDGVKTLIELGCDIERKYDTQVYHTGSHLMYIGMLMDGTHC